MFEYWLYINNTKGNTMIMTDQNYVHASHSYIWLRKFPISKYSFGLNCNFGANKWNFNMTMTGNFLCLKKQDQNGRKHYKLNSNESYQKICRKWKERDKKKK